MFWLIFLFLFYRMLKSNSFSTCDRVCMWLAVWQDLAKFYHCGKILIVFGFFEFLFSIWVKFRTYFGQKLTVGQIYMAVNGQILNPYFIRLFTLFVQVGLHVHFLLMDYSTRFDSHIFFVWASPTLRFKDCFLRTRI